ncbi:MAG TPA: carboxypeptidase-like regulatory domain-containing protein [Terriglobia bacterium]|nr:carboxypeptidase-like regulatory domain-containing protein [Terriglobia bacterium]
MVFPTILLLLQVAAAQLTGSVLDPKGVSVPNASIVLTEVGTNTEIRAVSEASGSFTVFPVKPGLYRITVNSPGFQNIVREGVRMTTGERLRLDFNLKVGAPGQSITVTEDAPILRDASANLGQVVDKDKVVDLPLNGRSFVTLSQLAPGVALPPGSTLPRINGGRPRTNEYLYDGISVLQPEPGQVAFMPVIDAIQEFKIESNSPSAEFGRFNGGVVNLTMKSGTNELHGSLFEFFRNEALNARNLFAPATAANPHKPEFRRNQYGFVLGGPIVKDNTFFFLDYQGSRQLVGRVRTSNVPTLAQRQGIFTSAIFDPATTRTDSSGAIIRDPFASNTIPADRIDPAALGLLNRYPLPTTSGAANNYTRVGNETDNQDQGDFRLDHRFGNADRVFGRYSYALGVQDPVTPLPDGGGVLTSGALGHTRTVGQSFASQYLHMFGTSTNELRAGNTRRTIHLAATTLSSPASASLGIPGIPTNAAFSNALPTFVISGLQQLGPAASAYSDTHTDVTEIADTLAFQCGAHFLKAGMDFRLERMDIVQPPSPTGSFTFSAVETGIPSSATSGSALASLLLGQVDTFAIDLQQSVLKPRAKIMEAFVQDDWKATRRLFVNAGVRYTLNFPSTEANDHGAIFNRTTQKLQYLGQNGFPKTARELHKLNFGPRVGLSYRVMDKTVIRSGYAVVWIEQTGITTPFTVPYFPFLQKVTQRSLDGVNPAFVLATGPSVSASGPTEDAGLGQGVFAVDRGVGSGYVQQWNLSIQREITSNLSLEIAYAGSKITRVGIPDTNINQLTTQQLSLGTALTASVANPFFGIIPRSSSLGNPTIPAGQLLKPYPQFTNVTLFRNNVGSTNYNSLEVKIEKRFSRGLSVLANYTRSKLIDQASSVFDASLITGPTQNYPAADTYNRSLERDVSTGDMPNVFVVGSTYHLPDGKGHSLFGSGPLARIVGGWELSGMVTLQSGVPLALTQITNFNSFAGFGIQRPNRLTNPELPASQRSVSKWFDTAAFTVAPQFTIGNSSRNPVRGPAYRNADIALIKRTMLSERTSLEFRTEVFNFTNTPPLGAPNVVLGNAAFGTIASAGDPRVIQFGLKVGF